jgi:hypothetical protein
MADQPLHLRPDAELEAALRGFTKAIDWPVAAPASGDGPDLAAVVRSRIEAAPRTAVPARPRPSWRPIPRALAAAIVILLALAVVAAAIGLGLPGLRLIVGPVPTAISPPPSLEPSRSPAAGAPGASMGLGELVRLADLDARAGFAVTWPPDPAIGPPDAAYIDASMGGQVALVWRSRPGLPDTLEPGVGLVLTAFRGVVDDGFFSKVIGSGTTTVEDVTVHGGRGFWVSGDPHFLFYTGPDGFVDDDRRWVGDALLWARGPITYRLETSLGREAAIGLADSMP